MEKNQSIKDLKVSNLCFYLKSSNYIDCGFSSRVYKVEKSSGINEKSSGINEKSFILKEIFIDSKNPNHKLNELEINYNLSYNPKFKSLRSHIVPFYGYDRCSFEKYDTLVLKFEYMGKNLLNSYSEYSEYEIKIIISEIKKIIRKFNKLGIRHNDVNISNVFVRRHSPDEIRRMSPKFKFDIKISDWGKGEINDSEKFKRTFEDFGTSGPLTLNYSESMIKILKSFSYDEIIEMLKKLQFRNLDEVKNSSLYDNYIFKVNKELQYQKQKFKYKPLSFLESDDFVSKVHFYFLMLELQQILMKLADFDEISRF